MSRSRFCLLVSALCALLSLPWLLSANPPAGTPPIENTLAVQKAMIDAQYYLQHGNSPKKAVEVLEAQLAHVDRNAAFLKLLRDAYRAHVRDLYLANENKAAQLYLERLAILDPTAANELRTKPTAMVPAKPVAEPKSPGLFPDFLKNNPFVKKEQKPAAPPPPPTDVRAKNDADDDPFQAGNRRPDEKGQLAAQFLAKAEAAFGQRCYVEAHNYYEQAYQADKSSVAASRDRWAYCLLSHVDQQLDRPALSPTALADLHAQVQGAMTMSAKVNGEAGKRLLAIEQRQKGGAAQVAASTSFAVQHLGRNREGWLVADTPNFRIFHKQTESYAEQVAKISERTRIEMQRKWFGNDGAAWTPKCELILHPTGQEYTQMTNVSSASPGHSRIESDPSNAARVIARRMDLRLDAPGMMDAVLPHEATHVVLAGQFGSVPVPRWADEGIAVLTEPSDKVQQHRYNLLKAHRDGLLFGVKELMNLQDYPEPRRISAFYAQSVVLVDFLAQRKGPTTFTSFVRDGLRDGYDLALQRHYSLTYTQLQQQWDAYVGGEMNKVTALSQAP